MFAIIIGFWLALLEPQPQDTTVTASATARGATINFAQAEADYRCSRSIAAACASKKLLPPDDVTHQLPDCALDANEIAVCAVECVAECAVAKPVEDDE